MTNNLKVFLDLRDECYRQCTANCPTEDSQHCNGDPSCCPIDKNVRRIAGNSKLAYTILTQEERVELHKINNTPDDSILTTLLYDDTRQSERHFARQKLIDTTPSYVFERIGLVV